MKDTIFALSTVPGLSAISVFRISGPNAFFVLSKITKAKVPQNRLASLREIFWEGEIIDKCIVIAFKQNDSYSGEETVEIHCHGSIAVINKLASILTQCGSELNIRPAEEGEFTRQAFYNGKMDLIQVEGLSDLLRAETEAQRKISFDSLNGVISKKVGTWKTKIVSILAFLEADIDFNDQDLGAVEVLNMISDLSGLLKKELDNFKGVRSIKEGLDIAIIGPPNVGKSTLINRLSRRDVSLTSRIAGTTRDIIESRIRINGNFVTFLDTAGLRKTNDIIEKKGIKVLKKRLKEVVLKVFLVNKESDLKTIGIKVGPDDLVFKAKADRGNNTRFNGISGKTGLGIKEAIDLIETKLPKFYSSDGVIATYRQQTKINNLVMLLSDLTFNIKDGLDAELLAEKARDCLKIIEELTGRIDTEEVLGIIFKSFCIGK
ncbi:tRNA uridine-5-carboxymethylaminomethyl(34) synthesis GTPase MnmE [Paracoccaceae bacterium]|nr:tRNA uridine-5-carboxymethylaminomethyl(34) synthesis GTPase MnmE [Paracoccaceae bacterium]